MNEKVASWRSILRLWIDRLNAVAALVCHGLLVIITTITVAQVFLRFVLNSPTSWSEEVALLCLIWFGLLAVAIGIRRHEHVAITFFRDLLPGPLATALDILAQLAMGYFMFTVMLHASDLIKLVGIQALPASSLPKSLLYFPTIVGGTLGTLNAAANLLLGDIRPEPLDSTEASNAN
ncbi:TRAP transporter small permease [Granulosicoccus sp. 3-233]|uniref:TRAP transporter small permease n=1 Tax=Granulosicoccus sp. 3-233 TaxID=3417969 RepID=UPI003D328EB6